MFILDALSLRRFLGEWFMSCCIHMNVKSGFLSRGLHCSEMILNVMAGRCLSETAFVSQ